MGAGRRDPGTLQRAERIPTTVASDIVRDVGHPDQVLALSIRAMNTPVRRTVGWAHTVTGSASRPGESGPDHLKAQAIDAMTTDSVAVWGGDTVDGVCLFGDLLALGMQVRGVRGAVVDGGIRDLDDMNDAGFPVFARFTTPKASTGFWRVREAQVPVDLPGVLATTVTVHPGDLIIADTDGIVCVPVALVEDVLSGAEAKLGRETDMRQRIERSDSLDELLHRYGSI